ETSLAPLEDVKIFAKIIEKENRDLMVVGHLPHLSKLSSFLLTGDENKEILKFKMAGVFALEKEEKWRVSFIITPDLL
ncbi:MAG: phosphohistidine phosphatase SixA, partial [Caldiserica bacterium]